jgi:hypothetical protein
MIRRAIIRMPMSDAEAGRWAAIRQRGRDRYVLMNGVLGWGAPTGLATTIITHWLGSPGPFLGRAAVALVVFSLGGVFYGRMTWSLHEQRYHGQGAP